MSEALDSILAGLATNLLTITSPSQMQAFAYLPDAFTTPAAVSTVTSVEYHESGGAYGIIETTVTVLVARTDARQAQITMQQFMDPSGSTSVKAAIESDTTLGGLVSDLIVTKATRGPAVTVGTDAKVYLTCDFDVTIYP